MTTAVYGEGKEGSPLVLRRRIEKPDGSGDLIAPSDITSISWKSWEVETPLEKQLYDYRRLYVDGPTTPDDITTGTFTPADVILDPPADWDRPSGTYNFHAVPAAAILGASDPDEGQKRQWVRIDVTFTPATGSAYTLTWYAERYPTPA